MIDWRGERERELYPNESGVRKNARDRIHESGKGRRVKEGEDVPKKSRHSHGISLSPSILIEKEMEERGANGYFLCYFSNCVRKKDCRSFCSSLSSNLLTSSPSLTKLLGLLFSHLISFSICPFIHLFCPLFMLEGKERKREIKKRNGREGETGRKEFDMKERLVEKFR